MENYIKTKTPIVSVLMPVLNGGKHLREAIDSILGQSYRNFEFIIINDGSIDKTHDIITSYDDPRIRLITNPKNLGLPRSLNYGIHSSKGKYIARMDCDDVSYPKRLSIQIEYLEKHSNIDICGSGAEFFNKEKAKAIYPQDHELIRCKLLFRNAVVHPSVMLRKNAILKNRLLYSPAFEYSEDYELWTRSIRKLKFVNLPKILLRYRLSDGQRSNNVEGKKHYSNIVRKNYLKALGIPVSPEELRVHNDISLNYYKPTFEFIKKAENWLVRIQKYNQSNYIFDDKYLSLTLEEQWFRICNHTTTLGLWSVRKYFSSDLYFFSRDSLRHSAIILLKWGLSRLKI